MMKELTFKEKMELYNDLVREKEIIVSRIKTFEHIANSCRYGGRSYTIYYMAKVHDPRYYNPRYYNGVHKDYRHKLSEDESKDLFEFAEMRMKKLIKEKDEINNKIRELESN